jgi:hypothetical protein
MTPAQQQEMWLRFGALMSKSTNSNLTPDVLASRLAKGVGAAAQHEAAFLETLRYLYLKTLEFEERLAELEERP